MKGIKRLAASTLFLISILILNHADTESVQKWKGNIRKENGVIVIENRGSGKYGKEILDKIEFRKILSLGADKEPEYLMFGRHIMIDVDLHQNMFVLDIQNHRLLKFDNNGQFQWKTGRKGQGPGEIEAPFDIKTTDDGDIILADQGGKLHYFDQKGNFQKIIRLEKTIKSIISCSKDRIFANLWIKGQPGIAAARFSKDGNLTNYFPVEYRYGPKLSSRRAYNLGGAFKLFGNVLFLSLPDNYEIQEYSLEGKLLKKIRRDIKIKPPILKDGYKFITRDISGPCYFTSNGFLINKLYLIENKEKDIYKTYLDFFNEKYEFLGSYPLQSGTYLAKIDAFNNFYFVQSNNYIKVIKCTLKVN